MRVWGVGGGGGAEFILGGVKGEEEGGRWVALEVAGGGGAGSGDGVAAGCTDRM